MRAKSVSFSTALIALAGSIAAPALARVPVEAGDEVTSPATVSGDPAAPVVAANAMEEASRDLYCRRRLGTWFYCEKRKVEPAPAITAPPAPSASEQLKAITARLDELKARAVLDPSIENVTAYITFQRAQLDRASTFADVWQRAVWQNPALDYTLQRPVSTVGKRAWLDNRAADRNTVMRRLGERYGVFYFYAQSCAACEIQGPILRSLANMNGLHVQAVSMDGGPNRSFPDYLVDSGQRARMGLNGRETPALVLFDTATHRAIPIGSGLMAADEIIDRIFVLTQVKPGSDY